MRRGIDAVHENDKVTEPFSSYGEVAVGVQDFRIVRPGLRRIGYEGKVVHDTVRGSGQRFRRLNMGGETELT